MNIKVIYRSQTGNTKKVAEAIGDALGIKAEPIGPKPETLSADILFLGAAVYATFNHDVDPALRTFIEGLNPTKVKKAVLFCTGFAETAIQSMRPILEHKGIKVNNESFFCKGMLFVIFNFGHPNTTDLKTAAEFARDVVKKSSV